jgi:hypothetical protein
MIQLSQSAYQALDFAEVCLLKGLCTPKEYLKAVKDIWKIDFKMQKQFLMDRKMEVQYDR